MPKDEWGAKRTCPSCGVRFYDLKRSPIVCPKCGESFDPAELARPRRAKPEPKAAPVKKPKENLIDDEDVEAAGVGDEDGDVEEEPAKVVLEDTEDDEDDEDGPKTSDDARIVSDDDDDDSDNLEADVLLEEEDEDDDDDDLDLDVTKRPDDDDT